MPQSLKTALHFVMLLIAGCIIFGVFLAGAVEKLNTAREEELKAVTVRQGLLRRLTKQALSKVMGSGEGFRQDGEFNLPLTAPETAGMPPQSTAESDPDYVSVTTAHFKIYGYNQELLRFLSSRIESWYGNIVSDTGLFEAGMLPRAVRVDIMRDRTEYIARSGRAEWSAGMIKIEQGEVCTFESPRVGSTIPHELTHLAIGIFLGKRADSSDLRWINEGLAVHEEDKAGAKPEAALRQYLRDKLPETGLFGVAGLLAAKPDENTPQEAANLWYATAGSLVEFMIGIDGGKQFRDFLKVLGKGETAEQAFETAYAGTYSSLADLEKNFRERLKRDER